VAIVVHSVRVCVCHSCRLRVGFELGTRCFGRALTRRRRSGRYSEAAVASGFTEDASPIIGGNHFSSLSVRLVLNSNQASVSLSHYHQDCLSSKRPKIRLSNIDCVKSSLEERDEKNLELEMSLLSRCTSGGQRPERKKYPHMHCVPAHHQPCRNLSRISTYSRYRYYLSMLIGCQQSFASQPARGAHGYPDPESLGSRHPGATSEATAACAHHEENITMAIVPWRFAGDRGVRTSNPAMIVAYRVSRTCMLDHIIAPSGWHWLGMRLRFLSQVSNVWRILTHVVKFRLAESILRGRCLV
jgi:hypothetical protein